MDTTTIILVLIVVVLFGVIIWNYRRYTVFEHERGLLYKNGKYIRLLGPGSYRVFSTGYTLQKIDTRLRVITLQGQEILSADNVGLKVSMVCSYRVSDPYLAIMEVEAYQQALYLELQTNLRDIIGEIPIEDFLTKRNEIGDKVLARTSDRVAQFGITTDAVSIKDIMFPGDLKNIFAQVVNARQEGVAALERARGETAALRNLANAAKLMDKNPALLQLRLLQAIEKNSGNTIVLGDITDGEFKQMLTRRKK